MGLTQAQIQIAPQLFPLGVKRQEREWDHLPRSSVNFKNGRLQILFLTSRRIKKHYAAGKHYVFNENKTVIITQKNYGEKIERDNIEEK
jgi:hypothetical protein